MNMPKININDAIDIALQYADIKNEDPCCLSAVYEGEFFSLTIFTYFQKYEFYIHGISGEVCGMNSEPCLCFTDEVIQITDQMIS